MAHTPDPQALNRLRNTAPSRDRCDQLNRLALTMDGDDAQLLTDLADWLLDARQTLRGGRRDLAGGRRWDPR